MQRMIDIIIGLKDAPKCLQAQILSWKYIGQTIQE